MNVRRGGGGLTLKSESAETLKVQAVIAYVKARVHLHLSSGFGKMLHEKNN